jgi:hypothetical protein
MRYVAAPECETPNSVGVRPAAVVAATTATASTGMEPLPGDASRPAAKVAEPAPARIVSEAASTAVPAERARCAPRCVHAFFHIVVSLVCECSGCTDLRGNSAREKRGYAMETRSFAAVLRECSAARQSPSLTA